MNKQSKHFEVRESNYFLCFVLWSESCELLRISRTADEVWVVSKSRATASQHSFEFEEKWKMFARCWFCETQKVVQERKNKICLTEYQLMGSRRRSDHPCNTPEPWSRSIWAAAPRRSTPDPRAMEVRQLRSPYHRRPSRPPPHNRRPRFFGAARRSGWHARRWRDTSEIAMTWLSSYYMLR